MLLDATVIILREVLEASIVLALLFLLSRQRDISLAWAPAGLLIGLVGAIAFAGNLEAISTWQDYVGQELLNAAIYGGIFLLLLAVSCLYFGQPGERSQRCLLPLLMAAVVALTTTREGAEIILYISAYAGQPEGLQSVLLGSGIGAGIGMSLGVVCYYGLAQVAGQSAGSFAHAFLALFGAGILSQSVLMLLQADWLPMQLPVWDSSAWIAESSLPGQMLFALFSYEATPAPAQVAAWAVGALLLFLLPLWLASRSLPERGA